MDYIHLKESVRDLENRVLRSEMRRQELEQQFEFLMRDRTKCEQQSAIKLLKHRCEHAAPTSSSSSMLLPSSRNRGLLQMLERIDYQAATLAAKTEQLKLLKTQHELNLMTQWSTTASTSRPLDRSSYHHHHLPDPDSLSTPRSEFVRFARNAQQPPGERHVAFADDHGAPQQPPQPVVLRPPMDFLTYAGKRWVLDPTQFAEAVTSAPPMVVCEPEPSMMRRPPPEKNYSSEYLYQRSDNSKRQQQDLLSKLQSVQPLLQQRYARELDDDEPPQTTPLRASVYPKFETYLTKDELRVHEADTPDDRFEGIVQEVHRDDVVIEDIVEPVENVPESAPKKSKDIIEPIEDILIKPPPVEESIKPSTAEVAEKNPAATSFSIEDVLYGEKIADVADDGFGAADKIVPPEQLLEPDQDINNQIEHPVPLESTPTASNNDMITDSKHPQITQPVENPIVTPAAEFSVAVEEYNYQPNEPVYSDVDYSKQYEYQEYDQSAYDQAGSNAPAVEYDQQQAAYGDDQNYVQQEQIYEDSSQPQQQQQQEQLDPYPQQDQVAYDESQYAPTDPNNTDPNNQQIPAQETYDPQQYASEYDQQQQYAPDPNAEGAYPAAQPEDEPGYGQQNEYDQNQQQQQQYADPNADAMPQQDPNSAIDQQQYAEDQQQYAADPNGYYAQAEYAQPQDDAYDPNAEYQVAQEDTGDPNTAQQPDAYYGSEQQAQPPLAGDDQQQYYANDPSVQYDYEQSGDQQLAAQTAADTPLNVAADDHQQQQLPNAAAVVAPANYVTSEADDSNVSGNTANAADGSLAANTESDFDFSVK